ncbi:MAG: hypothetical protein K0R60_1794, partial [Microbacterium sp.]|nr:hypothetical protein [Microbacterium sp.]
MTAYPSWTPAPRAGIVPLHPLTFGTILGRSFTALRRNPKVLLGFALGMQMLAYIVLLLVVGGVAFASFSRQGVVIADVAHGVISEKLTVGALWRRVRPAFWRLMGWTFLSVVIVAAVVAALVVAIVGLGALEPVAGVIAAILIVLAAIPVVIFFTTKLFLVPEVLVLEGGGVFAAIGRSWRLTRGRFWKTFGIWILIQFTFGIIAQVVGIPFSLLSGLLSSVIAPTGAAEPSAVIGLLATAGLTQIVTLLIQSVALVVGASAGTLVYVDARMRTEGLDHDLQSYVEQRQAGAGLADPYRWHIGRQIAPAPSYAPPGYSPAAAQQGYPQTGYPQGYPQPGYPP